MDVAIFASAYWDEPLWTNKQHIAVRLAQRGHRVLYIEPGFSRPILRNRLGLGAGAARGLPIAGTTRTAEGVEVLSPLLLPLRRGPGPVLACGWRLLAWWCGAAQRAAGFAQRWALIVYHPEGWRLIRLMRPAVSLYDCVDDIASQPHIARNPALAAAVRASESRLVRSATCVTATSRPLWDIRRQENPCAHYVPNVGDYAHFSRAQAPLPEAAALAGVPRPRACFVGALDPYKVDYAVLEALCERMPDWTIVLAGPATTVDGNEHLARLCARPNVRFLGPWPYAELPELLAAMDCLILPYRMSEHTRFVFPLKFFEFLATGKPVVSTPLPSLVEYGDVVRFARSSEEWASLVGGSPASAGREQRIELARANTWETRAGRLEGILEGYLAGRPPEPG